MANLLPNIELHFPGTSKVLARLIFRTVLETASFTTKSIGPLEVLPLSFIYLGNMYWQKGKPFLFNNEVNEFSPKGIYCLEWIAFKLLYREILIAADIVHSLPAYSEKLKLSDDMIDALAVAANISSQRFAEYKFESQPENKIKDKLDLPALENSLNQAVRNENYEAAADIRNKIEARQHVIIETKGRLLIRRRCL
jgi:hypothetical protein